MKPTNIALLFLIIALSFNFTINAQNKEEKKKEKKIVIKIDKEENGKITKVDTTIVLKEGEDPAKILEKYGVKGDKNMAHSQTFNIKIDDGDTSNINKEEKMVLVTVENEMDSLENCLNHGNMVFITSDDDMMNMDDDNVMIMRHPHGKKIVHIKKINGNDSDDSLFIEKHIIMDEDMDMGGQKVFRYEFDNNGLIRSDIQGPPMFAEGMHDNSDSTIIIVKSYKDGKEITDTKRVMRNEKKEKKVMLKVLDPEKADLSILKLKENFKKLEIKDFNIMMNNNKMQINFELPSKDNTAIKMIDKTGKALFAEDLKQFQGKYSKEIEALKGEFYIQIGQGSKYFVRKVILDFN